MTVADDLVFHSAIDVAAMIRARHVSAIETLDRYLEQIERHNAALNAVVTLDVERARSRARDADEAMACGAVWGPLHGVPITIKDAIETAGLRTTGGYLPLAEHIPETDATVVTRLKTAGAIVVGKTNLPVLSGDYQSDNPIFGRTNNPWDQLHGPGGSSGGSAAAIAAGFSALELGSDYSGSIRIPAHFCGVYGLRPSEWRVPMTGHIPGLPGSPKMTRHINTIGPLARSLDDIELALRVIAGPDGHDWAVPPIPLEATPTHLLTHWRLAWTDDFGVRVSAETSEAIGRLVGELQQLGCRIEQHSPAQQGADLADTWETIFEIASMEGGSTLTPQAEQERYQTLVATADDNDPPRRGQVRGANASMRQYAAALVRREALQVALGRFFTAFDALLCPVSVGPAPPHCPPGTPIQVDDHHLPYMLAGIAYTCPFSVAGYPSAVIPLTRSAAGLPIGLQVVGPRWGEIGLLAIARQIAEVTGGYVRPPGYG